MVNGAFLAYMDSSNEVIDVQLYFLNTRIHAIRARAYNLSNSNRIDEKLSNRYNTIISLVL